jgi:hypothetical protein
MATQSGYGVGATWVTDRSRLAAATYLAVAGLCNLLAAGWLAANAGADWLITWLIATFVGTAGQFGGLNLAGGLPWLATWGVWLLAGLLVVLGAVGLYAAWLAVVGVRWRRTVAGAALTSLGPLALPAGLVAVALLVLGRGQFDADEAADAPAAI